MNKREANPRDAPPGAEPPGRVTPMMEQYVEIRAANPDCLLFYRMGDFYELFFDDAVTASRALGITLTKRGRHLGEDIPMCGVPVHAADDYLQKLIGLGHRVAVCEQTEDPAEARRRGSKSVVRRAVTRLVTPGTITEDRLLDAGRNNFLAAIVRIAGSESVYRHAIAWTDISTGEFRIGECPPGGLAAFLARIEPREVLVAEKLAQEAEIRDANALAGASLTPLPAAFFDAASAEQRLSGLFGVKTMEAFGNFSRWELAAGAGLLAYVEKTQVSKRPKLEPPRRTADRDTMRIDAATRANLELFHTLSGARAGSLLAAIDRTVTGAGARLLARRLSEPSMEVETIADRLDAVHWMLTKPAIRQEIRDALAALPDLARALSRLSLDRGGPRDLAAVQQGLEIAARMSSLLAEGNDLVGENEKLPADIVEVARTLHGTSAPDELSAAIGKALADDPPLLKRDGGFIREGCRADLDEARKLRDDSRRVIAGLQARYAAEADIRSLKIKHNNVLGYFIEVGAGQSERLLAPPLNARFVHRQTMAGAYRFATAELAELEAKIADAGERALAMEFQVFDDLVARVAAASEAIRAIAGALAVLDVAAALATLADEQNYCRPLVDDSLAFEIEGGRHAVVEQALKADGQSFVGNDCALGPSFPLPSRERVAPDVSQGSGEGEAQSDSAPVPPLPTLRPLRQAQDGGPPTPASGEGEKGRIWLVTGPNMAGKSTFLRQNALIAILAQAGAFVPAKRAHIGIVDAVFSRVGAADDLARGRSTFMVEMVETAAILNQAGPRALVILDEIGRGTATFDGLSIAWAAVEHLHEHNRCRALFATHYHELTALSAKLPRLMNATLKVKEWKGDVIFLHEIVPGAADRSYGIQVAKLAGLPASVIARARTVLESLEKSDRSRPKVIIDDLPLFAVRPAAQTDSAPQPALAALDAINPDELSPKEALETLYELKRMRREEGPT